MCLCLVSVSAVVCLGYSYFQAFIYLGHPHTSCHPFSLLSYALATLMVQLSCALTNPHVQAVLCLGYLHVSFLSCHVSLPVKCLSCYLSLLSPFPSFHMPWSPSSQLTPILQAVMSLDKALVSAVMCLRQFNTPVVLFHGYPHDQAVMCLCHLMFWQTCAFATLIAHLSCALATLIAQLSCALASLMPQLSYALATLMPQLSYTLANPHFPAVMCPCQPSYPGCHVP